jgi:microcystin-dependent protein
MSNAPNLAAAATVAGGLAPAGVLLPFAGSTAPTGWLLCAGQAISRATYAGLFAVIGTAYGAGDGTTTFNVPDLRGRIPAGKDNMGGYGSKQAHCCRERY